MAFMPRSRSRTSRACSGLIVDTAEQDILEGDPLAFAERKGFDGFEERGDVPFAGDRHDLLADLVVGGVEAEGELGPQGLVGEAANGGLDAAGGDGHAGLGDADGFDEKVDTGDELVVVEEGLAHPHEDEVDAVCADFDSVAVKDRNDLAGDLACT